MSDPSILAVLNVALVLVTIAFAAAHLAHRGDVIEMQKQEIAGLQARLNRKNLFGFDDNVEADDVLDDFVNDVERIDDLLARGLVRDARHECDRTLERYS